MRTLMFRVNCSKAIRRGKVKAEPGLGLVLEDLQKGWGRFGSGESGVWGGTGPWGGGSDILYGRTQKNNTGKSIPVEKSSKETPGKRGAYQKRYRRPGSRRMQLGGRPKISTWVEKHGEQYFRRAGG